MTNSYLLIVSSDGLVLIANENMSTERFLARRCRHRRHERCYWACLATENAQLIRWLIACGHHRPALWLLNEAALDAGPVMPSPANLPADAGNFLAC